VESSSFADPRRTPRFDVFLSYNTRDAAIVERIARRLREEGFEPWLDRWSLTAGAEWQRELGEGLDAAAACAVFVGPHDLAAWELQEVAVVVDRAARERTFRVFPVLLPGIEEQFELDRLPHFLRTRMWVDLRGGDKDERAMCQLLNAVRGVPVGTGIADAPVADAAGPTGDAGVPVPAARRVFLCHSPADRGKVRMLYARLGADGFAPWLDEEDLSPGDSRELAIRRAVRAADFVVACLSAASTTSAGHMHKELKEALDLADEQPQGTIFVIPLRFEDCAVPDRLSHLHAVDLFSDTGYSRLVCGLRRAAGRL
jgi:hypothetical protein